MKSNEDEKRSVFRMPLFWQVPGSNCYPKFNSETLGATRSLGTMPRYSLTRSLPLIGARTPAWMPFDPIWRSDLSFEGQLQLAASFTFPLPL